MIRKSIWAALPLALGMITISCQSQDPVLTAGEKPNPFGSEGLDNTAPDPARTAAFAKEYAALKAKGIPPQERGQAIIELANRYGFSTHAPSSDLSENEAVPVALPVTDAGLEKAAAASGYMKTKLIVRKSRRIRADYGFVESFLIPAGKTIKVDAIASANNYDPYSTPTQYLPQADPFVVGTLSTSNTTNCCDSRFDVIGFSDDVDAAAGNFNGAFTWTNTSNQLVQVDLAAFLYDAQSRGFMTLKVRIGSGNSYVTQLNQERFVTAAPIYDNMANPDPVCTLGPSKTFVRLAKDASSVAPSYFSVMGINAQTMRGAFVAAVFSSLDMQDVLPSGYPNLLVGIYDVGTRVPTTPPYSYLAEQLDMFSCPN